jgi:putative hemolysin
VLLDLLVVLVLVLVNGFLAMSELAIVSARRAKLQAAADRGSRGAQAALALADRPGHFLSAVQVGITLVGLTAGMFSGTSIAGPLAGHLQEMGVGARIADVLAFGGVVTVVTYLSLVIGELVPKQLALRHPEALAAWVAPAMHLLTRLAWPLVVVLEASSRTALGWLSTPGSRQAKVTSEEIRALIAEAETAGVVSPQARRMMAGALRLAERKLRAIMTPRDEVDWIDLDADAAEIRARLSASTHSRLPAAHGSIDTASGVIRSKALLDRYLACESPDPRAYVQEAPILIETLGALQAMEVLRASGVHMVLVVDEYGVFQGLITTTNLLETIAGSFSAGGNDAAPSYTQRADGSWLLDGDLPVDEVADLVGVRFPAAHDYHTVAGFVLWSLQHIPAPGDAFTHLDWRFEVVDMDGKRIDKVLAQRAPGRRQAGPPP